MEPCLFDLLFFVSVALIHEIPPKCTDPTNLHSLVERLILYIKILGFLICKMDHGVIRKH